MDDPIKLIWKCKNRNRRVQYYQYIFVGDISEKILNILDKIKELNFYDSMIKLNKNEYDELEKKVADRDLEFTGLLRNEALPLFEKWSKKSDKKAY